MGVTFLNRELRNIEVELPRELLLKLTENDVARFFVLHLVKLFLLTDIMTDDAEERGFDRVKVAEKAAI